MYVSVALQILQITLLMADYMNMMGKTAPGTLSSAATPVATPKNRMNAPGGVAAGSAAALGGAGNGSRSSSRARGQLLTAPNTPRPDHKELTPRLSGVISSTGPGSCGPQRKWSHLE